MVDFKEAGKKFAIAAAAIAALLAGCEKQPTQLPPKIKEVVQQKHSVLDPTLEAAIGFFKRGELDLAVKKLEEARKSLETLSDIDPKHKPLLLRIKILEYVVQSTKKAHDDLADEMRRVKEYAPEKLKEYVLIWYDVHILPSIGALDDAYKLFLNKLGDVPMARAVLGTYATLLRDWRVVVERAVGVLEGAGLDVSKLKQLVSELRLLEKASDKEIVRLK